MAMRTGFDPDDPDEQEMALDNEAPLVPPNRSSKNQICQMTANLVDNEMESCLLSLSNQHGFLTY